ncbi:MAG TPA: TonB-dependent receptor [Vicinamibacterales bacterium]|nr:TonB-dependent receptor [Vicinamibacterales bacterium]
MMSQALRRGAQRACIAVTVVLVAALCAPVPASAQQRGELAGSIFDQTGGTLVGAQVTLRGADSREGHTNVRGDFEFTSLPAGEYEVHAELNGFEPARRTIRVQAGERTTVALTMQVAIVEQAIVTAAKTGERDVQAIPLAVSAVSSNELERLGTQTVEQAAALAPSVTFSQNTGLGQLTIRGIGTNVVNAGSDPSSALYIDGVYLARPGMAFVEFLDLDRVEVLRGPQGTLYGRNAVGGALNLIPRLPTNDFEAAARFTTGNLGTLRAEALASGSLKRDRIMGRVAFVRSARDGYVRDLDHPDHPLGGDDVTAARGQLRIIFDRRASLLLSGDVNHQGGIPLTYNKVLQVKPGFQVDNPADLREVRTSALASNRTLQNGAAARLTMDLTPSITLVSLSAYRQLDFEFFVDADITELDLLTSHQHERQHQLSQEITVSSQQPRLTWVGGVFLFNEDDHQTYWVDQPPARAQVQLDPHVDASSRALFGQASVALTPRVSATAGLRYTREDKDIVNNGGRYDLDPPNLPFPGSVYSYSDSVEHAAWTPKFGLEMKLPGGGLTYISATRGFKSGGFNPSSTAPGRGFAPEWVWGYESGVKRDLLGGRSKVAVSAFVMDYTNLQVQTPIIPGVFDIRNAAAATIRGVEIENTTRFGSGVEAGGHLTWLDATYDQYIAVGLGGVTGDVAGNRLNNAPEWAGRLWVQWIRGIGPSGQLTLTADTTAQSTVYYTPFNDDIQRQRPYGLLGMRAEYGPSHRRWSINAYARNLTDTDYVMATFGTSPAAFGGRPGASRQFAIEFAVRR